MRNVSRRSSLSSSCPRRTINQCYNQPTLVDRANAPSLALLACWPLHGRTADLLRAVHVKASCLQLMTAWNRRTRAAEQLECCACRACRRGVKGGPPAAVELAERRSSACLGLGRAQCIAMPRSGALDVLIPPLTAVFREPANSTWGRVVRIT